MKDTIKPKNLEIKLHRKEEKFRRVVNALPALVWSANSNGFLDFANQTLMEFTGFSFEKVKGWHWTNLIHPEDRPQLIDEWLTALATGERIVTEARMQRANGEYKWFLIRAVPLQDESGKIIKWLGTKTDITDRKQAEEALQKTEKFFRAIVEDQSEMIVRWKPNGMLTFVNKAFSGTFGKPTEELVGTNFWLLIAEPYRGRLFERISSLTLNSSFSTDIYENLLPDGKMQWQEWSHHGFFDEHNNLIDIQSVGRDITESKRTEKIQQTFSQRLIEAQENEKRQISIELHDEIGQSLTALKFTLQSIEKISKKIPDYPNLDNAISQLDYTQEQIKNLSFNLRPSILDHLGLNATVKWFIEKVTQPLKIMFELSSNIEAKRFPQEIEICCFRIIQSAVINSIKHSDATKLIIYLWYDTKNIYARISDNGNGFNVQEAFKNAEAGKSMGLLNMRERATLLNGELKIKSYSSKGTEILLTLPLIKKHAE
jgi:PAS domain S-box-containing protein